MSIQPLFTFKAGLCDLDGSATPPVVKARPTPGYIYLYRNEDELIHFCWRPRATSLNAPELDLLMVPGDAQFVPYKAGEPTSTEKPKSSTNGRIFVLKFSSSSQRHLFWMQSKSQSTTGDPTFFSPRDLRLGGLVNDLLQGEDVSIPTIVREIREGNNGGDADDDEPMEDVEGTSGPGDHHRGGSGGAGADATGGDIREEGEGPREGGADGGRASGASDASALVQNLLNSLGGSSSGLAQLQRGGSSQTGKAPTTLPDLLPPSSTIPIIERADRAYIDHLLSYLPPSLVLLAQEAEDFSSFEAMPESAEAAARTLSLEQKKDILRKVLRSPQFVQSLGSLTVALRDGGLPSIGEALQLKVANGGFMRRGGMPMGGGEAVDAFVDGVKRTVEEEDTGNAQEAGDRMDTDH